MSSAAVTLCLFSLYSSWNLSHRWVLRHSIGYFNWKERYYKIGLSVRHHLRCLFVNVTASTVLHNRETEYIWSSNTEDILKACNGFVFHLSSSGHPRKLFSLCTQRNNDKLVFALFSNPKVLLVIVSHLSLSTLSGLSLLPGIAVNALLALCAVTDKRNILID